VRTRALQRLFFSAALTGGAQEALLKLTAGQAAWERKNFRGSTVNLAGGVATAAASVVGAARLPSPLRAPALLATGVAAATGCADDFAAQPAAAKGLKGHLKALARGELTTGAVKLLGISAAAVLGAGMIARGRAGGKASFAVDTLTSGALIAGTANLINLFDLRPGRALKVCAGLAAGIAADPRNREGRALAHTAAGVALGAAPRDLNETTMLGDVGANALGALLGVALASHPRARSRAGALAAVTGLILTSEKVSFSKVIESRPALARLDAWGRT